MIDDTLKIAFAQDVAKLRQQGVNVIVVHGGGKEITRTAAALGIETRFVDGQRYTDEAMVRVVRMVLAGGVNKEIVGMLGDAGCPAIGICGVDGRLLRTRRLKPNGVDLGLVGEVVTVNSTMLNNLLDAGLLPVIAPLGVGADDETHNVNADLAAAAVARAMCADRLIFLSDIEGINDGKRVVPTLTSAGARDLIKQGVISGGMIPKINSALDALKAGVRSVHIIDGRRRGSLAGIFGGEASGTHIVHERNNASIRKGHKHVSAFSVAS
jgi:acetylglutamate kinase